jgi:membrane protein YqaA with SNARE-associated domain
MDVQSTPRAAGWVARAYGRMQLWADAGWSNTVVLAWGLLQGGVLPGLADVFFLPLALARPQRAYALALAATTGTMIGSVLLYVLGAQALELLEGPLAARLGLTVARVNDYRATLAHYGGWAIFASTMSPLSTKLTSIASGAVGVPWPQFFFALLGGRLLRTLGLAWLVQHGGAQAVARFVKPPGTGRQIK